VKLRHAASLALAGWYLMAVPSAAQGLAGDGPVNGRQILCKQDSDCPGVSRCQGWFCGRGNMWCKSDSECKYSEVCDPKKGEWRYTPTLKFVGGVCTPRKPK
jgi:hypothetical protein